jgi:SAM-dependent methyltransferase
MCRGPLEAVGPEQFCCPLDQQEFRQINGIWHFLPAERSAYYAHFVDDYEAIRQAEGRGSIDPAYYRALPEQDLSGRHTAAWRIRAASYHTFIQHVLAPFEQEQQRPLTILDLGAGNGWLSYRLSQRGHDVAAVDLTTNEFDGLGAHRYYDLAFQSLLAEFDRLPLPDGAADVVIYNASFHYSTNYEQTLAEAQRVMQTGGIVVIIDTPVYRQAASGRQMVSERQRQFADAYGRAGDALNNENYLTQARLAELARRQGVVWREYWPLPRWRRWLRSGRIWLAGNLYRRREPAQFPILLAQWQR